MTDAAPTPNPELVARFAALVARAVEQPADAAELRAAAKGVAEAAKAGAVTFALVDGALLADGAPVDAPLLAARLATYGIEEIGITPRASQADLFDLAKLLASPPGDGDPVARFSSRAAVIDTRTIPRKLRARREPQAEPVPLMPAAPPPRQSKATPARGIANGTASGTAGGTPSGTRPVTPPVTPAVPAPGDGPAPIVPVISSMRVAPPPPPEPRDVPVRLSAPLAIPETAHPTLATAITLLRHADDAKRLANALEQIVAFSDLAFRQGRHDDLIEGIAALIAIEFIQLERDSSDAQRQAFNHAIRRLARPVLLRQLATLRQARAADARAAERLQAALFRFGIDAAEAMIDECASAADAATFATCLESLRGLPRAQEALRAQLTHQNELIVRQAIAILGALRDGPSEAALDGLLDRADARVRRDAVAALARFDTENSFASLALALGDESPVVRLRALTALSARKEPRTLPILEPMLRTESDREVLFALVAALGAIGAGGSSDAVQTLIQIAQGQGANPQRDSAALRIQACIALVAIRTPQAMAAVQVLRDDRDREVRAASMRLVAHARRRPTTQQVAIVSEP